MVTKSNRAAPADREIASRAVDRAMKLLDLLSRAEAPMGVREMARVLGFPPSVTHRLLSTLEHHRFVRPDAASGKYRLGTGVLRLSARLLEKLDIREIARPIMREMRDQCDENVALYILEGLERVCVEMVESRRGVRRVIGVGQRRPLHTGAPGKVLLAYLPWRLQEEVLRGPLERFNERTIADPDQLRRHLEEIRTQGFATSMGEHDPDTGTVAAPVWGHGEEGVIAALGIAVPLMRFDAERQPSLIALVMEGAARISSMAGGGA